MHVETREGINYYYRFEEINEHDLKLHLMLVNTTKKPFKLKAQDFYWQAQETQGYPLKKMAWIKQNMARAETLASREKKQLLYEVSLVDRFMLDEESHLVPDSPTKTYVLLPKPAAHLTSFTLFLGPRASGVKVKRQ